MMKVLIVYHLVVAIPFVLPGPRCVMGQVLLTQSSVSLLPSSSLSLSSMHVQEEREAQGMESENMSNEENEIVPNVEHDDDDNVRMTFRNSTEMTTTGFRLFRHFRNRHSIRNRTNLTKEEAECERQGYSRSQLEEQDRQQIDIWGWHGHENMDRNKKCKSATVNARGTYTSNLQACTFQFHRVYAPYIIKNFSMSSACSAKNVLNDKDVVNELEDYVVSWPDECVGDYQRCYSLKRDQKILMRHMCKANWKLPEGATHVSVDCTADKQIKIKKLDKNLFLEQQHQHHLEFYAFILILVSILLCSCFVCLICLYRYGFKPYLAVLKRSKSDSELQGLVRHKDGKLDRIHDDANDNDQVETGNSGGSAVQQRMPSAATARSRSRS